VRETVLDRRPGVVSFLHVLEGLGPQKRACARPSWTADPAHNKKQVGVASDLRIYGWAVRDSNPGPWD